MKEYITMYESMQVLAFDTKEPVMAKLCIGKDYYNIFKTGNIFFHKHKDKNKSIKISLPVLPNPSDMEMSIIVHNYLYNIDYLELYNAISV